MKNLKFLQTLLLCTVLSLCFTACSNDDDENVSPIVGSWRCDHRWYYGPDTYTFYADGTFLWECPNFNSYPKLTGIYTYDEKSGVLTEVYDDGGSSLSIVNIVSSDKFIFTDEDGDSYTYKRVN